MVVTTSWFWLTGESEGEDKDVYSSSREQAYAQNGEATYCPPITGVKQNPINPLTRPMFNALLKNVYEMLQWVE